MPEEILRYTYRLRPGAQAERALLDEWHRCRFLWNEAVHQKTSGQCANQARLGRLLTEARKANAWLRSGSQNAQQNALNAYAEALGRSGAGRRGRPRAKSRRRALPSLHYTRNGFSLRAKAGEPLRLRLPKGVTIPVVWSRDLPSQPSSVSVTQDSLGHWYAHFVVRRATEALPVASDGIGIDWGVSTTATTTDASFDLSYGGYRARCAAELAKGQRRMSRRRRARGQAPSRGYRQAQRAVAKLHKKAKRQNQHAARTWAKRVVAHHGMIAVEDFRARYLTKSTMARKAADAAIGASKRELVERAQRAGRKVVLVTPAHTTMTCSNCFARAKQRLGLAVRTFRCWSCGHTEDRDRNAARVILAVAERGHTSVDAVRHPLPSSSEVGTAVQAELGISAFKAESR